MTDWKEFWMGAGGRFIDEGEDSYIVFRDMLGFRVKPNQDPYDPSVPLEALLDGLEGRINGEWCHVEPWEAYKDGNFIQGYIVVRHTHIQDRNKWEPIAWAADRRAAIISAICKLLGTKEADNGTS